jgi:hypothetical protein
MEDLSSLLSSISPDDMEKIRSIASSIVPEISVPADAQMPSDASKPSPLMSIMQGVNSSDEKSELIKALKPFLTDEKRARADEALRLLKLIKILPLLKEININDLPV